MTDALEMTTEAPPKVLIADDDPYVLQFLAERCATMGFEVQTATNGLQALMMARRSRPDVLIVDVNMPEVDGLALCARLRDLGKKRIEMIVVTGNSSPETIERCEGIGAIYGRKGPDLWNIVRSALTEICPGMAPGIAEMETPTVPECPRILVVDDDPDVGLFLASRLRKYGVHTLIAPDGVRGYQIACREKPSVIISDYFMPDGDAHYLLWRLRSTPATAKIPVFVISGRRLDAETEARLSRDYGGRPGAARLFEKPLDINELFLALQKYCDLGLRPH